jgi:hypothetical protein
VAPTDAWAPANATTSSSAMILMCIMVVEDCRRVGGLGQRCNCDQCQQLKLMQQKHPTPHKRACRRARLHWCEGKSAAGWRNAWWGGTIAGARWPQTSLIPMLWEP